MRKIALFGGSFNPPHFGHFNQAAFIQKSLNLDEVWFLFSINWQKDPNIYASLEDRMEMGRIMAGQYPDSKFIMSDMEYQLQTHITHEVVSGIIQKFPDDRFVWMMGADSFLNLHTWENADDIVRNIPLAVLARDTYTEKALSGITALTYPHLQTSQSNLLNAQSGWAIMDNHSEDVISSSQILKDLRQGQRVFPAALQPIIDYIFETNLYGISGSRATNDHIPHPNL